MEESDNMLITTAKDYITLPEKIRTLNDIKAEELYEISLTILEHFRQ
jgi:hypothetical protein